MSEASVSRGGSSVARHDTINLIKHLEKSHVKEYKEYNPNHIFAFNLYCSCPHYTHTASSSCTFNSAWCCYICRSVSSNFWSTKERHAIQKAPFVYIRVKHRDARLCDASSAGPETARKPCWCACCKIQLDACEMQTLHAFYVLPIGAY